MARYPRMDYFLYIIYPERRWVTQARITDWYNDAAADGRLEKGITDPMEQARALEDIGFITVGLGRPT